MEVREGFKIPVWIPIVLGLAVVGFIGYTYVDMQQARLSAEARIKQLDFKLRDFQKILDSYEMAKNEKDYLQAKRDFVNGISQNQKQWIDFFDELRAKMPKDCWIENFQGMRAGQYNLEGKTFTFSSVGFFMLQFNSIPQISTVTLDNATSSGTGSQNAAEAVAKSFRVSGDMKLAVSDDGKGKSRP